MNERTGSCRIGIPARSNSSAHAFVKAPDVDLKTVPAQGAGYLHQLSFGASATEGKEPLKVSVSYSARRASQLREKNVWSLLSICSDGIAFDQAELFGHEAPLVLEIGCGMGDATVVMAAADPDRDYLQPLTCTPPASRTC